jgi:small-conductance mechanosensitive channel
MTDITSVLDYHLFSIGNQPITPAQLVVLVIALLVTALIARAGRRLIEERLLRHMAEGQRYTLARLSHHTIWLLGIVVGLRMVNIDLTALTIVVGALGLGVGLGLQSIVADFVAGIVLLFERPIKVHDRVTSEAFEGNVVAINFRATTIVTNDNITMIVPNSEFVNRRVINWSHEDPKIRIHLPIGVAYGSDTRLVTETLLEVARADFAVRDEPPPTVHFVEFGDSSLNFELLVWIDNPAEHFRLRSRLNYAIDEAFRTRGIQIPFPQRDLHVRTVPAALAPQA